MRTNKNVIRAIGVIAFGLLGVFTPAQATEMNDWIYCMDACPKDLEEFCEPRGKTYLAYCAYEDCRGDHSDRIWTVMVECGDAK